MSAIRQQEQVICELLFKSLDGELNDAEIARLERLIVSDKDARHSYLEHAMLIADLIHGLRGDSLGNSKS
jgi:anti-sigma factor RsiW